MQVSLSRFLGMIAGPSQSEACQPRILGTCLLGPRARATPSSRLPQPKAVCRGRFKQRVTAGRESVCMAGTVLSTLAPVVGCSVQFLVTAVRMDDCRAGWSVLQRRPQVVVDTNGPVVW